MRLTFEIGISSRRRGTLKQHRFGFADNIFRSYSHVYFPSSILFRFLRLSYGGTQEEKRLLVDTYLIVSDRYTELRYTFTSPVRNVVVWVIVVAVVVGHASPHEDTLLIGRCQWFDPS